MPLYGPILAKEFPDWKNQKLHRRIMYFDVWAWFKGKVMK